MNENADIAIIGGGAGGLVAAISAAEGARNAGIEANIHIYEATDKIGRPILASGNGRCNFSNSHIDPHLYRNGDFAQGCLSKVNAIFEPMPANQSNCAAKVSEPHCPNGVVSWFSAHGLMYAEEGEGRLYPRANKSSSVLDVLRQALDVFDVQVKLGSKVLSIDAPKPSSDHLTMRMADGSFERAHRVILACGGTATAGMLPEAAIDFTDTTPVLCPIEVASVDKKTCRGLENIRVKCDLSIIRDGAVIAQERGEAMFRKYGISGICAFNLSRFMHSGDILRMDMFPDKGKDALVELLHERRRAFEGVYGHPPKVEELMCGMVLPRVAEALVVRAGIRADEPCNDGAVAALADVMHAIDFTVEGPADIEHAQVRRGGFDADGICPSTLEVKGLPGVYVIGEAIDVDGPCGGYNLTWAFSTGLLAGRAAVSRLAHLQGA